MLPDSVGGDNSDEDFYDAEILDEMTTRRGELKLRTVSLRRDALSCNPSYHYLGTSSFSINFRKLNQ